MTRQYHRQCRVTIAKPTGFFSQSTANAIVVEGLRVQFRVEKHLGKNPNTGEITITNLAERTRAELDDRLHLQLEVGYDGGYARLFSGDVRDANSRKNGSEWETRLELGNGERAYRHARIRRAFKGGVSTADAVRELARAMGLKSPPNRVLNQLGREFVGGLSLSGSAAAELDRVLTPIGKRWSIQDDRLQILGESEVRSEQALVLDAGIVDSPEIGATGSGRKRRRVLTLTHLLRPDIIPGGKIQVTSRQFKAALFKVERADFEGDTHGVPWYVRVEAKPL